MKALIVKEPGQPEYTEFPKPVPKDDEALIKIYRNGICATDMEIVSGIASFMHDGTTSYPVRFGHEYSGIVEAVGKDCVNVKVGDKVVGEGVISCGKCENCLKGDYKNCLDTKCVGTLKTWPGSYAEYMVLPGRHLHVVPENISHDEAALIEPCAIAMTGVNKAKIVPGESVCLVTGVGAIGIAAAAFCKWRGAKKVIISGRTQYKLDIAKAMGVDVCCNPREQDLVELVMKETDGHGADCVIECSGNISVLDDCMASLAHRGKIVIVGLYGKPYEKFDIDGFLFKECSLDVVVDHAIPDVIQALKDGIDVTPLITRHIKFSECGDFMKQLLKEKTSDIKVMVDYDEFC